MKGSLVLPPPPNVRLSVVAKNDLTRKKKFLTAMPMLASEDPTAKASTNAAKMIPVLVITDLANFRYWDACVDWCRARACIIHVL